MTSWKNLSDREESLLKTFVYDWPAAIYHDSKIKYELVKFKYKLVKYIKPN